jgi:hypothetical protein
LETTTKNNLRLERCTRLQHIVPVGFLCESERVEEKLGKGMENFYDFLILFE